MLCHDRQMTMGKPDCYSYKIQGLYRAKGRVNIKDVMLAQVYYCQC